MPKDGEIREFILNGTEWIDTEYRVGQRVQARFDEEWDAWLATDGSQYYIHTSGHPAYREWGGDPADEKRIRVSWYACDCDYLSKYCDEYHQASALVPVSVLEEYRA